mgnify:CR=1 FL=1
MGSKLKVLSGQDLTKIFSNFGFNVIAQKGSHMKLRRVILGNNENLIIQNSKEIPTGTLKSIFNQASKYVSKEELYKYFYNK